MWHPSRFIYKHTESTLTATNINRSGENNIFTISGAIPLANGTGDKGKETGGCSHVWRMGQYKYRRRLLGAFTNPPPPGEYSNLMSKEVTQAFGRLNLCSSSSRPAPEKNRRIEKNTSINLGRSRSKSRKYHPIFRLTHRRIAQRADSSGRNFIAVSLKHRQEAVLRSHRRHTEAMRDRSPAKPWVSMWCSRCHVRFWISCTAVQNRVGIGREE
ncbi:hypothetical protein F5146DRAFT_168703 [Armillaria mellea]|nr:hypothetical protein F5146DRAFT_168703 [Armillaria mellea]